MAITEKDKKRIAEEEAYRQQLREEQQYRQELRGNKKGGSNALKFILLLIIGLPILLAITLVAINPAEQYKKAEEEAVNDLQSNIGKYAYNKTSGAYQGQILDVKNCATYPDMRCYLVDQPSYERPREHPVDNVDVRDEPTISK